MEKQLEFEMFEGAVSLEKGDGWVKPWRIPHQDRLLHSPGLVERAQVTSGVRLRLKTDAQKIGLRCIPININRLFDLTVNGSIVQTAVLPAGDQEVWFRDLGEEQQVVEIWLPSGEPVQINTLLLEGGDTVPAPDQRKRWLTYGSSISQCKTAFSPARIWPGVAARREGVNLLSLGFGGNCHLEPLIAKLIRDSRADAISLKLGINVYGGSTLSERTFTPAVIGMIERIRENHPDTPMAVISPIYSPNREETPNAVGFTLQKIRELVQESVDRIQTALGDKNLYYFSGLELLGPDLAEFLPDQLHPDGTGYEIMGKNFSKKIFPSINPC